MCAGRGVGTALFSECHKHFIDTSPAFHLVDPTAASADLIFEVHDSHRHTVSILDPHRDIGVVQTPKTTGRLVRPRDHQFLCRRERARTRRCRGDGGTCQRLGGDWARGGLLLVVVFFFVAADAPLPLPTRSAIPAMAPPRTARRVMRLLVGTTPSWSANGLLKSLDGT